MKSIEEIQEILISELNLNIGKINDNVPSGYYNKALGNSSFLLAGLLGQLMSNKDDWEPDRWFDDSLLTKVKLDNGRLSIWGIMIWGKTDVTEQWADPFYFEIIQSQNRTAFTQYTFLFSDLNNPEITYEYFNEHRYFWDKEYYSTNEWNPSERDWKYIINKKVD